MAIDVIRDCETIRERPSSGTKRLDENEDKDRVQRGACDGQLVIVVP